MTKLARTALALGALGASIGVMIAVLGPPYGRINHSAFAELYHGETDTTGTVHMALDCDTFTAGTQNHCAFFASGFSLGVTVGNSLGHDVAISAFNFKVKNNRQDLFNPAPGVDYNWDANPDFNQSVSGGLPWTCFNPPPVADSDPSPGVSSSELQCNTGLPATAIPLPDGPSHVRLASVHYNGSGPIGSEQLATFTLSDVGVFDDGYAELMSCNPVVTVTGPCFGATATWGLPPPPTFPPTPTSTPTALPTPTDYDSDGVLNDDDNCPNTSNADQLNADANLISNAPVFAQVDTTRAKSDDDGDACDDDDDNDGVTDQVEMLHCPYGMWPTNPLAFDTDGDRFHDGAECALLTDATRPDSKPAITSCGAATDGDGDGLVARIEYCFYGTSDLMLDSDGDGVKDGCEAASFNPDTIVNVADRGMLASEIVRGVPPSSKLVNLDVNKDGAFNVGDIGLVAQRFGKCP